MDHRLQEIIAATGELPALPSTTSRLLALLDDESAGADAVLEVIGTDASLTANLLKLSNSAYYGLRRQVGTVNEALMMLGSRTVVSLAFATSLGDVLRGPLAGYRLERDVLWRHSLAVAVGAAHLAGTGAAGAPPSARVSRDRAFTAGLVHDIGKLVLNGALKAKLQQLPQTAGFDVLVRGEREILGFDHAEAGQALAESWNFPTGLATVIGAHHVPYTAGSPAVLGPEPADAALLRAVAGTNLTASRAGLGAGELCPDDAPWLEALDALGVAETDAREVLARLPGDVASLADALKGHP